MISSLYLLLLLSSAVIGNSAQDCSDEQFKCSSGECVQKDWRCDGEDDCEDGSDENCQDYVCPDDKFKCSSGACMPPESRCDAMYDCPDGSDEENCQGFVCEEENFSCSSGQCIAEDYRCDGDNDCTDNSDEENCQDFDCPDSRFQCTSGPCLPQYKRCDGREDCQDKSDEENCPDGDGVGYLDPGLGWDRETVEEIEWVTLEENCCDDCRKSHPDTTQFSMFKFAQGLIYCRCAKPAEGKQPTSVSLYEIYGDWGMENKTIAKMIEVPFTTDGFCGAGPCTVVEGPNKGKPCMLPFTWTATGKTYTECAYEPSTGDTFAWCSTKVDDSGTHVNGGGHWGKCDPATCPGTDVS